MRLKLTQFLHFFVYRLAHEAIHKAHKGHESMHAQMLLILMVTVLVAQIVLVEWRKRHFRSYQVQYNTQVIYLIKVFNFGFLLIIKGATLAAMWVIPLVLSLRYQKQFPISSTETIYWFTFSILIFKELLVEIHFLLATFLNNLFSSFKKSPWKASTWLNTSASL